MRRSHLLLSWLLIAILWPGLGEGEQTPKFNVDCWGITGVCEICPREGHLGAYDCSDWHAFFTGCPFADPLPPDTFVSQIQVDLYYMWAIKQSTQEYGFDYTVSVNGSPLATEPLRGEGWCDDCAIQTFLSEQFVNGFPVYGYGAPNNMLNVPRAPGHPDTVICVESADVTIFYHNRDLLLIDLETTVIPEGSTLADGKVLTRSNLSLTLGGSSGLSPAGVIIELVSDRGVTDDITQPEPTDQNGQTTAVCETTDQQELLGISHIAAAPTPRVREGGDDALIDWLPVDYESTFYTTCYSTELESDYPKSKFVSASKYSWCNNETPPSAEYRRTFMKRVSFQGSGKATAGEIIQYLPSGKCYYVSACPLTASGQCATVGTTTAIARVVTPVIPWRGSFLINGLGVRQGLDVGQLIVGYDIDVYNGFGDAACAGWDNLNRQVEFLSY